MRPRSPRLSPVAVVAAVLSSIAVIVRAIVAARGWFYWDDLTLYAQARQYSAPSAELLFSSHDGHLMPGGWLLVWLLAKLWPLSWAPAAAMLIALQIAVLCATAWAVRATFSPAAETGRGITAAVVACFAATPLTLPASTWLASAVNTMPLMLFLALSIGSALRAVGRGEQRWLMAAAASVAAGCLFSERMMLVAPFAWAVVVLLRPAGTHTHWALRSALAMLTPAALWALVYVATVGWPAQAPESATSTAHPVSMIVRAYREGILPTFAGGPWSWQRWAPGPPWASPSWVAVAAGGIVMLALAFCVARLRHDRTRIALAWLVAAAYPLAPLAALVLYRSGEHTADEIALTLRHFCEASVLAAVALAATFGRLAGVQGAAARSAGGNTAGWRTVDTVVAVAAVLLAASSMVSFAAYDRVWHDQPAKGYFAAVSRGIALRDAPLLDQDVDINVLLPVVHPYNRLSKLLPEGAVADATTAPAIVDSRGEVRDAGLYALRATQPGRDGDCGTRVDGPTELRLDGPLLDRTWVVLLNYLAERDGTLTLDLGADPAQVPVKQGLNQVYVQVSGSGDTLHVDAEQGIGTLCIQRSEVGVLAVK